MSDLTATDPGERSDVSYISTSSVDLEREVVDPAGVVLDVFEKNRVVLFQHDQDRPCGKNLWIKADAKGLLAKTYYPPAPEKYTGGEWLPEKVWGLVSSGIIAGKSITFLPLEVGTPDEHQKAAGCEVVYPKSLLLEYSCVAIPCNSDSIVQAIEKKLDLGLLGIEIKKTGQRVQQKTKRTVMKDRTPDLCKAMELLSLDPAQIADKVIAALANRGKI